ncbi:MAG TPA: hypothetical protein VFN74_02700 [Chloroflexota bacterium]|nr:hypothetical protein [Chloroflexota bacterium]
MGARRLCAGANNPPEAAWEWTKFITTRGNVIEQVFGDRQGGRVAAGS